MEAENFPLVDQGSATSPVDTLSMSRNRRPMPPRPTGRRARHVGAAAVVVAAFLCAGPFDSVQAQSTTNDQQTGQTGDQAQENDQGTSELQEVVVTAERRAEDVQSTPIAVTAVTGDQLKSQQIMGLDALQNVAPSLSIVDTGTFTLVTMRGVGNTLNENPIQTGVPVIVNGLDNPLGLGLDAPLFDLADVELLRGPQGTFIGASSTGGAIEINTVNPNFSGVHGYATAQFGDYHDYMDEAAVNLPLTDTLSFRLAAHSEMRNSFYSYQGIDQTELPTSHETDTDPGNMDEHSFRVSALWKPTSNFQLLFKGEFDENNTDGIPYNVNPASFAPLPGLGCPSPGANQTPPNCHNEYIGYYSGNPWVLNYQLQATPYRYTQSSYIGETRYTFGNGDVLRVYGGSELFANDEVSPNCDCGLYAGYSLATPSNTAVDNVEADLIGPSTGKLQWILGSSLVYTHQPYDSYTVTTWPAPSTVTDPSITIFPLQIGTRSTGVFGNVTWQFTPTLQLEAGLRGNFDNDYQDGFEARWGAGTYTCPGGPPPCLYPNSTPNTFLAGNGVFKENHQTGKIGLNWQATPAEYFYGFFARSYKPGVTQFHSVTVNSTLSDAQAETLDDFELGWKGTYLQHRLTTQLGTYYSSYDDLQENIFNPAQPQAGGVSNVPHAFIDGIEANMQMQAGGFGANVGLAYTHSSLSPLLDIATYKEPPGFGTGAGGFLALPGCPAGVATNSTCFQYAPYIVSLKGEETPYSPRITANVTVQYAFRFGAATLQPRLQFSHTDKQYANLFEQDAYYEIDAHDLLNAYLDFIDGEWQTTAYVTNLTNETYELSNTGGAVLYGAPRQYGVKFTRNF